VPQKKKRMRNASVLFCTFDQTARVTLPERKHRVQAYTLFGEPSTIALTRRMLAFQVRLERLCECDT
jgi:hypothetical protein